MDYDNYTNIDYSGYLFRVIGDFGKIQVMGKVDNVNENSLNLEYCGYITNKQMLPGFLIFQRNFIGNIPAKLSGQEMV